MKISMPGNVLVRIVLGGTAGLLIVVGMFSLLFHLVDVPFDGEVVFDSESILLLPRLPKTMTVLGAGVVGIEYASIFAALGIEVTLVDTRDRLLPYFDREIVATLTREMGELGVTVYHDDRYARITRLPGAVPRVACETQAGKRYEDALFSRQVVQARIADTGIYLHAWACTLSKLDKDIRAHAGNGEGDLEFQRDKAAALHFFDLAETWIDKNIRELTVNADDTMQAAAIAALKHNDTLPNSEFAIPERSPNAAGTGRKLKQDGIKQFPGDRYVGAESVRR